MIQTLTETLLQKNAYLAVLAVLINFSFVLMVLAPESFPRFTQLSQTAAGFPSFRPFPS